MNKTFTLNLSQVFFLGQVLQVVKPADFAQHRKKNKMLKALDDGFDLYDGKVNEYKDRLTNKTEEELRTASKELDAELKAGNVEITVDREALDYIKGAYSGVFSDENAKTYINANRQNSIMFEDVFEILDQAKVV